MTDAPVVGLVFDERCLEHRNGPGAFGAPPPPSWLPVLAFERPERLEWIIRAFAGAGLLSHLQRIEARAATDAELRYAHAAEYLGAVADCAAQARDEPVPMGHEAWVGPGTLTAARLAVGGLIEAVDAVLGGRVRHAYVAARPPGHHATRDAAMGFCLFNAVAVAARHAQHRHGVERVAVVDWDVHHGNGTEAIFLEDTSVLTISLHQDGLYPAGTGALDVVGAGTNVNVPLPDGCGDDAYLAAVRRVVVPALRRFTPQLVLVSAGQDAAAADPLGRMAMTAPGFRALAETVRDATEELCDGRLVAFQEGGYSLEHTAAATLSIVESLAGLPPTFATDPIGCDVPSGVGETAEAAISRAEAFHFGERSRA